MPAARAVQYLRMSTEHQRYSLDNQAAANLAYALEHGIEIVGTYRDAGVSGLTFERREGLKSLLRDVLAGQLGAEMILVYDVSRWGRFQDPDQAAHYEFLCRQAGIGVEYCAEAFANDGSPAATVLKSIKRMMAAEYSRDLSRKVFAAQVRVAQAGYHAGGSAPYGLRRAVVDDAGRVLLVLQDGEKKLTATYREKLIPGPEEEVACVRRIFRLFTITGLRQRSIARLLNEEGVPFRRGRPWRGHTVRMLLVNPAYVGEIRYNRRSIKMGGKAVSNPVSEQVITADAVEPIISTALFNRAQEIIKAGVCRLTDDELLDRLRVLAASGSKLSSALVDAAEDLPTAGVVRKRLGGLKGIWAMVGADIGGRPYRVHCRKYADQDMLDRLKALFEREGRLTYELINRSPELPSPTTYMKRFGTLRRAYALVGYECPTAPRTSFKTKYSDDAILTALGQMVMANGRVTRAMMDNSPDLPSSSTIERRFGSLARALAAAAQHPSSGGGVA